MRELEAYIDSVSGKPVVWGVDDCTAWPAGWIERRTGVAVRRPHWASEAEAAAIIAEAGSLLALWERVLDDNGISPTAEPVAGDVCVLRLSSAEVGGIILHGGFVACRAGNGFAMLRPRVGVMIRAWAVP